MNEPRERVLRIGRASFDPISGVIELDGRPTTLRPRTAAVFAHLFHQAGRVVTKDELMAAVWPGTVVTEDSLVQCVKEIRSALGHEGRNWIRTIPRQGYAVVAASSEPATQPLQQRVRWRSRGALVAIALLALMSSGAAWIMNGWPGRAAAPSMSIVVLPMQASPGDAQQDYIAEAVTDEITVDLSRIAGSFVIGRSTAARYRDRQVDARQLGRELGVRYVLEGKLGRRDADVQLTMQLIEAESGQTLWTERFEGRLGELAELHRRVTGTVARSLHLRMIEVESANAVRRGPGGAEAEDLALQAWWSMRRHTPEGIASARNLLQRAVAKNPESVLAWTLLAHTYAHDVALRRHQVQHGATRAEWLRRGEHAADQAYSLDPNHTGAIAVRAKILSFQGRAEEALAMLDRGLKLNPNDAGAWFLRSYTYVTLGRQEEAIKAGLEAVRISPRDHELAGFYVVIGAAHLYLGEDRQALTWARKSALEHSRFSIAYSWIASAAGLLHDAETARTAAAEFRRLQPDYTIATLRAENLCANEACREQRERYYDGLRKAGLAE